MRPAPFYCAAQVAILSMPLLCASGVATAQQTAPDSERMAAAPAAGLHPFAVRDSIEFSTFQYPGQLYLLQPSQVSISPDGKYFVAATMRGDLASGKRESTLWLFDSNAVRRHLRAVEPGVFAPARPLARFASASNKEPVSYWRWSSDSRSLLFLGADDAGAKRIYRVDLASGAMTPLSNPDQDISRYEERAGAIVYLAHAPVRTDDLYQAGGPGVPDIEVGTGKNVLPLLFPKALDIAFSESVDELWRISDGRPAPVLDPERNQPITLKDSRISLSPDGSKLVATQFVKRIPKSWESYRPLQPDPAFRIVADTPETEGSTNLYRPQQYTTIDLASGKSKVLVGAPIELGVRFSSVLPEWSDDGSRIALIGAYPPLGAKTQEPEASVPPCAIMVVGADGRQPTCVETSTPLDTARPYGDRQQMMDLQWRNNGRELVAEYATPNAPQDTSSKVFAQASGRWTSVTLAPSRAPDELVLKVDQDLDRRPVLTGRVGSGAPRALLDPNPQLANIALGSAALYHWKDIEGNEWTGALVKPADFASGRRYPLVIQSHNLDRAQYLVDGPSATGFAARALAGRGMLVLQVDEIRKNFGTPKESETGAAGYRAAIARLSKEGLVDPAKVGIIAWSHMGPYVLQGLVDEPNAYAAATFAEASYNTYGEYLMNIDYMGTARELMFRGQYGAKPFGEGLKTWLDQSAGFHTDRVCTPTLFQFNSPLALVYGWDLYAILRAQNKPVDFLYFRGGDHVLVKPRQRLIEQGMNVDWYDYWLNGHKDPDPAKADQYRRWDAMKASPPCGDPAEPPVKN